MFLLASTFTAISLLGRCAYAMLTNIHFVEMISKGTITCHHCMWLKSEMCFFLQPKFHQNRRDMLETTWAMKATLVVWGIMGILLPSYIGIIINHYKDPYSPTRPACGLRPLTEHLCASNKPLKAEVNSWLQMALRSWRIWIRRPVFETEKLHQRFFHKNDQ